MENNDRIVISRASFDVNYQILSQTSVCQNLLLSCRSFYYIFCRFRSHRYSILEKMLKSIWVKVFKNGPSKICGRQPLKDLKW